MKLTQKQIQLLGIIKKANPDGTNVDMNELIDRTDYKPSKASMQFSIRALIAKELIEKCDISKRRGRQHVSYQILPLGLHFTAGMTEAAFVVTPEEDAAMLSLEAALA